MSPETVEEGNEISAETKSAIRIGRGKVSVWLSRKPGRATVHLREKTQYLPQSCDAPVMIWSPALFKTFSTVKAKPD